MPKKRVPEPRSSSAILKRESSHQVSSEIQLPNANMYLDYNEFQKQIMKLKLPQNWSASPNLEDTLIKKDGGSFILPFCEIHTDKKLHFSIRILGWMLSKEQDVMKSNDETFNNATLLNLMHMINSYFLCPGIKVPDLNFQAKRHVIPKVFIFGQSSQGNISNLHQTVNTLELMNVKF